MKTNRDIPEAHCSHPTRFCLTVNAFCLKMSFCLLFILSFSDFIQHHVKGLFILNFNKSLIFMATEVALKVPLALFHFSFSFSRSCIEILNKWSRTLRDAVEGLWITSHSALLHLLYFFHFHLATKLWNDVCWSCSRLLWICQEWVNCCLKTQTVFSLWMQNSSTHTHTHQPACTHSKLLFRSIS